MYEDHSVGVVVPAYNESGHIGDVIWSIPAYVDRIYLVDDASTDATWEETLSAARDSDDTVIEAASEPPSTVAPDGGADALLERAEIHPQVGRLLPIRHHENLGAGGAIKTGYMAALRDGVDITVTIDGDGQMDPEQMPKLLDPIVSGKADYTKGNRLLHREYRKEMPWFRFFGNAVLTFLTKIASGYWKTVDPQNGYTAISKEALESIGVESIYEYYAYLNDILVRLNTQQMRVADVAIPAKYGDEQSSIKYPTYIGKVSGMLLGDFLWRLKLKYLVLDFHPLALFYFFGAGIVGLGGVGLAWAGYSTLAHGDSLFVPGALSFLIFALGSVCLLLAMVFDMQANEDREVQIYE